MLKTEVVKVDTYKILGKICDVCDNEFDISNVIECQEFIHINECGGYGSVFGDGSIIKLDICQHCFYKHFSFYIQEEE